MYQCNYSFWVCEIHLHFKIVLSDLLVCTPNIFTLKTSLFVVPPSMSPSAKYYKYLLVDFPTQKMQSKNCCKIPSFLLVNPKKYVGKSEKSFVVLGPGPKLNLTYIKIPNKSQLYEPEFSCIEVCVRKLKNLRKVC